MGKTLKLQGFHTTTTSNVKRNPPIFNNLYSSNAEQPFTHKGEYHGVYDLIQLLPMYKRAQELHLQSIANTGKINPIIADAGAGTGNLAIKVNKNFPFADVKLFDISKKMLNQAIAKGAIARNTHVSDIADLKINNTKVPSKTFDHICSYSVLWILKKPHLFFKEAARVLKDNGTLSITTIKPLNKNDDQYWIKQIKKDLKKSVKKGIITKLSADQFIAENSNLIENINSFLSLEELKKLGSQYGFTLEYNTSAYEFINEKGEEDHLFNFVSFKKIKTSLLDRPYKKDNNDCIFNKAIEIQEEVYNNNVNIQSYFQKNQLEGNLFNKGNVPKNNLHHYVVAGDNQIIATSLLERRDKEPLTIENEYPQVALNSLFKDFINSNDLSNCFEIKRVAKNPKFKGLAGIKLCLKNILETFAKQYGSFSKIPDNLCIIGHAICLKTLNSFSHAFNHELKVLYKNDVSFVWAVNAKSLKKVYLSI